MPEQTEQTAPGAQPEGTVPALTDYPMAIRATSRELRAVAKAADELHVEVKGHKLRLMEHIKQNEKQFTNDTTRTARLAVLMEEDQDAVLAVGKEAQARENEADLKEELENLRGMFAIALLAEMNRQGDEKPATAPVGVAIYQTIYQAPGALEA
jgi:rubrerythrin